MGDDVAGMIGQTLPVRVLVRGLVRPRAVATSVRCALVPFRGPALSCSPRHIMPCNSISEDSKCMSMTWQGLYFHDVTPVF